MRITGGIHGGRALAVPKSDAIRPTQDRVREALFNIIQCEVGGADFLDLFAGSGAVGLEALSRGAKSVTFVELSRRHAAVLQKNVDAVSSPVDAVSSPVDAVSSPVDAVSHRVSDGRENSSIRRGETPRLRADAGETPRLRTDAGEPPRLLVADAYRWIAAYAGPGFSIAFADPPYALGEEKGYASVLATLAARNVVRPGGLFIAEMTAVQKSEETPGWELLRDRTYGKTRLVIWRRT